MCKGTLNINFSKKIPAKNLRIDFLGFGWSLELSAEWIWDVLNLFSVQKLSSNLLVSLKPQGEDYMDLSFSQTGEVMLVKIAAAATVTLV